MLEPATHLSAQLTLDVMAATDIFTIEVWMPQGLVTYYVLFVIYLSTQND
jgi:hypothetical protein